MTKVSEADVIKYLDDQLGALEDVAARTRILRWANEKFSPQGVLSAAPAQQAPSPGISTPRRATKNRAKSSARAAAVVAPIVLIKDLNLKPSGKKSFDDFVKSKQPTSNPERCVVAVYYLKSELGLLKVSIGHVFTCFKIQGWRVPSDLANALQYTASRNGWLETSDRSDIKLTTHGENFVEHDMPPKTIAGKKA